MDDATDSAALHPRKETKSKKLAFLGWTFENQFNLAIDEVVIYVNSMTTADPDSIHWTIETNAYHGVLKDKNYNTIKLETPEGESFHEFITLKLVMDPRKVEEFFGCYEVESQIEMRIKFKSDCKNLEAARTVKWLPNAKIRTEDELSCLDKIFKRKPDVLPKFHFIVAIDETAQFCKGPNGSIQPKLRKAVNKLIQKLVKKLDNHELQSFGLVIVRFGGILEEQDTFDTQRTFDRFEGPFRRQKIQQLGRGIRLGIPFGEKETVYEFAPFPDAKRGPDNNFEDYVNSLLHSDPKVLTPKSPTKSFNAEQAIPLLPTDEKSREVVETKKAINMPDKVIEDTGNKQGPQEDVENKESYTLDFLHAKYIIQEVQHFNGNLDVLDLFVSIFCANEIMAISKKNIRNDLNGDCNTFYPCLKDIIQYMDGFRLEINQQCRLGTLKALSISPTDQTTV